MISDELPSPFEPIAEVMDLHHAMFPDVFTSPFELTPERKAIISARLDTFTCNQLCLAIMNRRLLMVQEFKSESDSLTPEFIFASDETVRELLTMGNKKKNATN
ncbi:MAG: hypothetical protein JKX97_08675 [Candidatus Lindowbacteria bacterium]|nr:hypothetical protein [Candidatus Lindowbacteria bacterium]